MIGVLSDAHGNHFAFRLAISKLKALGASEFIFLGDSVGYIPSIGVVDAIVECGESIRCIKGNHEKMFLTDGLEVSREAIYQFRKVRSLTTSVQFRFLDSWPTHLKKCCEGHNVLFVHGGPGDYTNEYIYPDTDLSRLTVSEEFVFMGHTHFPFIKKHGPNTFVNVGSCGLPRDDGRFGSAALFDPTNKNVRLIRFDISDETRRVLKSCGPVHSSVIQVFDRRLKKVQGEII